MRKYLILIALLMTSTMNAQTSIDKCKTLAEQSINKTLKGTPYISDGWEQVITTRTGINRLCHNCLLLSQSLYSAAITEQLAFMGRYPKFVASPSPTLWTFHYRVMNKYGELTYIRKNYLFYSNNTIFQVMRDTYIHSDTEPYTYTTNVE